MEAPNCVLKLMAAVNQRIIYATAAADEFHGPWAAKVYIVPGSKKAADSLNILGQLRLL